MDLPELEKIKKHREVSAIFIFGSYLEGKRPPYADIDVGILLSPYDKYLAAEIALSFPEKYDVVILNEAPVDLLYTILKKGKLIWLRSKEAYVQLETLAKKIRENYQVLKSFGVIE